MDEIKTISQEEFQPFEKDSYYSIPTDESLLIGYIPEHYDNVKLSEEYKTLLERLTTSEPRHVQLVIDDGTYKMPKELKDKLKSMLAK